MTAAFFNTHCRNGQKSDEIGEEKVWARQQKNQGECFFWQAQGLIKGRKFRSRSGHF
jgi:hypothetical protein